MANHLVKHGLSYTSEYRAWQTMRLRCTAPENPAYPDYGGRGITVCDRWSDSVENFVADMGPKPSEDHELDREDNDLGYTPANCRWVTRETNSRNRRSNRWVTYQGQRMVLVEAAAAAGIPYSTVSMRLKAGWGEARALSTPARAKAKNGEALPKHAPMTNKHGFPGVCQTQSGNYQGRTLVGGRRLQTATLSTPSEAHAALQILKQSHNVS